MAPSTTCRSVAEYSLASSTRASPAMCSAALWRFHTAATKAWERMTSCWQAWLWNCGRALQWPRTPCARFFTAACSSVADLKTPVRSLGSSFVIAKGFRVSKSCFRDTAMAFSAMRRLAFLSSRVESPCVWWIAPREMPSTRTWTNWAMLEVMLSSARAKLPSCCAGPTVMALSFLSLARASISYTEDPTSALTMVFFSTGGASLADAVIERRAGTTPPLSPVVSNSCSCL
mmetsp:Transcript_18270/g.70605  ORF Transcript_18270/g.70605 Transcript_18270/m.70605 type:complete len:231 (+) Transcript_18270:3271-3963(+)